MVIRVKNKKRIFAYLTIIYLLVMSGSVLHYKYMGTIGTINMNITIVFFACYLLTHKSRSRYLKKEINDIFMILAALGLIVVMLLGKSNFTGYLATYCALLMPWLIVQMVDLIIL